LPILEKEWGISDFQESLMGSLIYSGYLVGSLFSGFIADRYGRKYPIFLASGIMFALALIGAFMPNYILYTTFRLAFSSSLILEFCL
jgi:putative MFS transporter